LRGGKEVKEEGKGGAKEVLGVRRKKEVTRSCAGVEREGERRRRTMIRRRITRKRRMPRKRKRRSGRGEESTSSTGAGAISGEALSKIFLRSSLRDHNKKKE